MMKFGCLASWRSSWLCWPGQLLQPTLDLDPVSFDSQQALMWSMLPLMMQLVTTSQPCLAAAAAPPLLKRLGLPLDLCTAFSVTEISTSQ